MKNIDVKQLKSICSSFSVISDEFGRYQEVEGALKGFDVKYDNYGNLLVGNTLNPKVVVAAHADEVGVMIKSINNEGLAQIVSAGWIHPITLVNSFVDFKTKNGMVRGYVISGKMFAGGLSEGELKMSDLRVDFGVTNKNDLEKLDIKVGSLGTYSKYFAENKDTIEATGLDNGIGVYLIVELIKNNKELLKECVFLLHRGEENGSYGAKSFASKINPKYSLILDYAPSNIDMIRNNGDIYPDNGKGPTVCYVAQNYVIDTNLKEIIEQTAKKEKINLQPCFMASKGEVEVGHFQVNGSVGADVCVPARGFHGANYIINKRDIIDTYKLVKALILRLTS